MQTQFMAFIVEPFVEKRIGLGGRRWGILLDGLDELKGEGAQCEIIQLITTFLQEHPDVPLAWIIASRPESHISSTLEDDDVRRNCWSEYIPIDSTEACEDVERFFRASFKTIQKKFRRSVPKDWPSDTVFHTLEPLAGSEAIIMLYECPRNYQRLSRTSARNPARDVDTLWPFPSRHLYMRHQVSLSSQSARLES
jgi:hypothetical protein